MVDFILGATPPNQHDYTLDENMYVDGDPVNDDMLFEMSNLFPIDTGLAEVVWVSVKNVSHGPRIKVFKGAAATGSTFSVTIEDQPKVIGKPFVSAKELKKIFKFVNLNKENLIKYWDFQMSTREMLDSIKKLTLSIKIKGK